MMCLGIMPLYAVIQDILLEYVWIGLDAHLSGGLGVELFQQLLRLQLHLRQDKQRMHTQRLKHKYRSITSHIVIYLSST
jgi:hypothetical protein